MNGKINGESTLQGKLSMPMTYFELDTEMSDTSNNPVANKTIKKYIDSADKELSDEIEVIREKLENTKDIFFVGCSLDAETSEITSEVTVADLTSAIENDKLPVLVLDTNTWFNLVHHTDDGKFVFQTMSSDGLIEIVCIDDVWTIEYLDFVSAYKEMDLTDEQKAIARNNIGIEKEIFIAKYGTTTNAEIVEAYTAGKTVLCNYADTYIGYLTTRNNTNQQVFMSFVGGGMLAVFICNNNSWVMGQLHIPTVAKSTTGNLAQLNADGNIVDSGKAISDIAVAKKWYELNNTTLSAEANFVELELPEGYEEYIFQIYSPMPTESSPAVLYPYANYDNEGTHTAIVLPQWNYAAGLYSHWLSVTLKTVKMGDTLNFQIESVSRFAGNTNSHNPQQDGDVKKSQLFNTDEGRTLVEWARIRYERKLLAGTQYKLYGLK